VVNSADTALMTHLGKFGWWPVRYLENHQVEVRRDFLRLYSTQEVMEQMQRRSLSDRLPPWVMHGLRYVGKQVLSNLVGISVRAVLRLITGLLVWLKVM
jgi:hypothetical protein